jgi:hypothetical protein
MIVGIGLTAAVQLLGMTNQQNSFSARQSVAIMLANNIQELLATVAYRDPRYVGDDTHWTLDAGETFGPSNKNLGLEYFDRAVWGLDAATPGTPIDAGWQGMPAGPVNGGMSPMSRYSQKVIVQKVSKTDLQTVLAGNAKDQGVRRVVIQVWFRPTTTSPDALEYQLAYLRFADR